MASFMDVDGLWETYHHIAKLAELGCDERGNTWDQRHYALPLDLSPDSVLEVFRFHERGTICDTAMCFAGHYCALKAYAMNRHGDVYVKGFAGKDKVISAAHFTIASSGMPYDAGLDLFHAGNDLETIGAMLVEITGEDRR